VRPSLPIGAAPGALWLAFLLGVLACAPAHAAPGPFAWLDGLWVGEGTLMGKPATFEMRWNRVLGGRFQHLSFRNAQKIDGKTGPGLEAEGFYAPPDSVSGSGQWFDSRGGMLTLSWSASDSSVTVEWTGRESGRTIYERTSSGVRVTDHVRSAGALKPFASATYRRVED
jgi:hypothetical protein